MSKEQIKKLKDSQPWPPDLEKEFDLAIERLERQETARGK